MTIKASDCAWANFNFASTDEAQATLTQIEGEIKALKKTLAEGWFDDAFTVNEMKKELARLEAIEDELVDVLFQDLFDLL